jgi:nicotinate-nucleotide adenylyltransferase
MRVAYFGGSFDPPHVGHLLSAVYALALGFEKVLVVPVYEHAFGKRMAPFDTRVTLCRACFEGIEGVEVSAIEAELERPNYTERTLARLTTEHPDWELRLLIGSDVLADTSAWHDFPAVERLAPPFVLNRSGHERPGSGPVVLPEVSSTRVRELLTRQDEPEAAEELERLVSARVLAVVRSSGQYVRG